MTGGRCRGGGDCGQADDRLSQDEKQVWGMLTRLDPGASVCLLIWTIAGENTPERTDEQGETVRLKGAGEVRMDSLDEAGVGNWSAQLVGLALSSGTDAVCAEQACASSECPEIL